MKTILTVDDSWVARLGLKKMLGPEYRILEAESGAVALEILTTEVVDLILLDILMPVMDGFQVLTALKDQSHDQPVIVLSADIQETTRQKILQSGASAFLNKPPKPEILRETVERLLEGDQK